MIKFPIPRNELVIILPDEQLEPSQEAPSGGFIVPKELNAKPKTATVMIASKGYYSRENGVFIPIELKEGDRVLFNPFAGAPITVDGKLYLMLDEKEIKLKF